MKGRGRGEAIREVEGKKVQSDGYGGDEEVLSLRQPWFLRASVSPVLVLVSPCARGRRRRCAVFATITEQDAGSHHEGSLEDRW